MSSNLALVLPTEDGATLLHYAGNMLPQYAIKHPRARNLWACLLMTFPSIIIIYTTFVTLNYTVSYFML